MVAQDTALADRHRGAERLIAEGVDVIAAGFPCQDISFAGEGAGLAGSRSGLVWSLLRTIRLVRPRIALLENVAALLSRGLDQICGHLASVGYDTEWHCIPASAVGAPHQRDRIWIIATDAGSEQHQSDSPPLGGEIAAQLSCAVADTAALHGLKIVGHEPDGNGASIETVANTSRKQFDGIWSSAESARWRQPSNGCWWSAEPALDRMANGVPNRVDRLRGLGNSVVPQIPEIIGRAIMQVRGDQ